MSIHKAKLNTEFNGDDTVFTPLHILVCEVVYLPGICLHMHLWFETCSILKKIYLTIVKLANITPMNIICTELKLSSNYLFRLVALRWACQRVYSIIYIHIISVITESPQERHIYTLSYWSSVTCSHTNIYLQTAWHYTNNLLNRWIRFCTKLEQCNREKNITNDVAKFHTFWMFDL